MYLLTETKRMMAMMSMMNSKVHTGNHGNNAALEDNTGGAGKPPGLHQPVAVKNVILE